MAPVNCDWCDLRPVLGFVKEEAHGLTNVKGCCGAEDCVIGLTAAYKRETGATPGYVPLVRKVHDASGDERPAWWRDEHEAQFLEIQTLMADPEWLAAHSAFHTDEDGRIWGELRVDQGGIVDPNTYDHDISPEMKERLLAKVDDLVVAPPLPDPGRSLADVARALAPVATFVVGLAIGLAL